MCPKIGSTMCVSLRYIWYYWENSIQKLYCTSGWRSGLRRQTHELTLFVKVAFWSTYVGVGCNSTSDKMVFNTHIMLVYETIYMQVLNKSGSLTDVTCFPGKICPLRMWMIHPGKLVPLIKCLYKNSSLIYIPCVLYYDNVWSVGVHYFYVCPKIFSSMFVSLRHVCCYWENSIQKLYCTSGLPSGLRRENQELTLSVKGSFWPTYVGVGSNRSSDKMVFIPYKMFVYETIYICKSWTNEVF